MPKEVAQARGLKMEEEKMEAGWGAFEDKGGNCRQEEEAGMLERREVK